VKCFETTKCSEQDRKSCMVWKTYKDIPEEIENIKCWVIKGVYQDENREQLQKCRKCEYYRKMHQNTGITSSLSSDVAVVTCEGSINNDKTRALDQVWSNLKSNGKFKVLMDISNVTNIYSCGLGELIKIHKETEANKGVLLLVGAQQTVQRIIAGTRLDRILRFAADQDAAIKFFQDLKKKEVEVIEAAKMAALPPPRVIKTRIPCWVYWKGKNPKNATRCDECYKKITNSKDPCWMVIDMVEGISFQYVNEECVGCKYYDDFYDATDYSETSVEK
jgi:anti-anti-sigma factor